MKENKVIISKNTLFEGAISAAHITIEGKVMGNLQATSSIIIKEDGWVEGNIQAPKIYLAEGCYHEGDIYVDNSEQSSSARITVNQLELKSGNKDEGKDKEKETPKAQSASNRNKSELW